MPNLWTPNLATQARYVLIQHGTEGSLLTMFEKSVVKGRQTPWNRSKGNQSSRKSTSNISGNVSRSSRHRRPKRRLAVSQSRTLCHGSVLSVSTILGADLSLKASPGFWVAAINFLVSFALVWLLLFPCWAQCIIAGVRLLLWCNLRRKFWKFVDKKERYRKEEFPLSWLQHFLTTVFGLLYFDWRSLKGREKQHQRETTESSYLLYMQFANISKSNFTFSSYATYLFVSRFGNVDDDVKWRNCWRIGEGCRKNRWDRDQQTLGSIIERLFSVTTLHLSGENVHPALFVLSHTSCWNQISIYWPHQLACRWKL